MLLCRPPLRLVGWRRRWQQKRLLVIEDESPSAEKAHRKEENGNFNISHHPFSIRRYLTVRDGTAKAWPLKAADATWILTYRLDVFVTDESAVQLGAGDPELPVQIVGRLLVGVSHLSKDPFVVIDHFRSGKLDSVWRHFT